jgi:hypothetical protein
MFTAEERDRVQERLLARAEADGAIAGAAFTGLVRHHALHARICIERGRWWQAEHWISAMRDHVITLACLRLGYPAYYAKGAHLLPDDLTAPLAATLVRAPEEAELRRALAATIDVVTGELERSDPALATRLQPMFAELAGSGNVGCA